MFKHFDQPPRPRMIHLGRGVWEGVKAMTNI